VASWTSINSQPEHGVSAFDKKSGRFISRVDSMRDRGGILTTMNAVNDNERDLLMGAIAIADFLGITRRQAYRLIHDDIIPSFKLGGTVAARRSSLRSWMNTAESRVPA
jgi:predicted DNA-binding transcriptional regulator AlpA